jgi:DNA polymerase III sliding clamp (beta) subunit (PCNA family)
MLRQDFVDKLELVAPGLASSDQIEVMAHFWFTGSRLMAYNDQIALSLPMRTDFKCAIPKHVVPLLNASGFTNIDMAVSEKTFTIKAGKGHIKLPILGQETFTNLFEMPKSKVSTLASASKKSLIEALECCAMSVMDDATRPEYLGITLIRNDAVLSMFSTNGETLSHAKIDVGGWPVLNKEVILPTAFCQQMIKLLRRGPETVKIGIHNDHALFEADDVVLFGRLIITNRSINFPQIWKGLAPANNDDVLDMPNKMQMAIERACIVADAKGVTPRTKLTVGRKELILYTKTKLGEIRDSISNFEQDDASLSANPKHMRNGLGSFKQILVTEKCVVMCNAEKDQYFLVAPSAEERNAS